MRGITVKPIRQRMHRPLGQQEVVKISLPHEHSDGTFLTNNRFDCNWSISRLQAEQLMADLEAALNTCKACGSRQVMPTGLCKQCAIDTYEDKE